MAPKWLARRISIHVTVTKSTFTNGVPRPMHVRTLQAGRFPNGKH
ncbi:hypothetical protein RHECNPAF_770021 [Rhizobium etli CNPAF512]|nr:hypothetical protein RHECNPAF_770021 [Rhizobium etli CNPAF512]